MSKLFTTPSYSIKQINESILSGKLGLPNFQRSFRWDRKRTIELLQSIIYQYPAGSLLFYCPGTHGATFAPREIEGSPMKLKDVPSIELVLDGQQRVTSIFQSLNMAEGDEYYLDLKKVDEDLRAIKD